jgi:hypothetical protein
MGDHGEFGPLGQGRIKACGRRCGGGGVESGNG